tara:strand:- start:131 stop:472 length:342 start_codon:yes stop_codon:yes gene_type:complete
MTYYLRKQYSKGGRTQWILPMGVSIQCTIDNGFMVCSTDDLNVCNFVTRRLKFKQYTPVVPTVLVKKTPPVTMVRSVPTKITPKPSVKEKFEKAVNKKTKSKKSSTKKSHSER